MRRTVLAFLVVVSALLWTASSALAGARAATRPRYGGTLRVEMRARVASLDPREMPVSSPAAEKLALLVFERLVRLDESGRPQPQLAVAWQRDADVKRWQFRLRPGVSFHDGSALAPQAVAAALQPLLGRDRSVSLSGEWLVIESQQPMPDLLGELARGRNFVFRVAADGSIAGTGAFRISEWLPGRWLVVGANEDYWAGRPFLDSITVEMGVAASQQLVNLELGKADVVELLPEQIRRASQMGARTWSSAPVELLALVFDPGRPAAQDARVRQAVASAIDRASIWNVLLQKQGEAAGGLLPQWLSGYAFLFSTAADLERAKRLRAEFSALPALSLVYDSADPVARAVAERIAVNARAAGITMQAGPQKADARADARLMRLPIRSLEAAAALRELVVPLGLADAYKPRSSSFEDLYSAERRLVETYRVVPLFHLPETYALSAPVKNWMPPRCGGWRLEDVWLDLSPSAAAGGTP